MRFKYKELQIGHFQQKNSKSSPYKATGHSYQKQFQCSADGKMTYNKLRNVYTQQCIELQVRALRVSAILTQ